MPARAAKYADGKPPDRPVPKPQRRKGLMATSDLETYADDELEFLKAVEKYRREKSRPFPTNTELLGILKGLGWRKVT
jgi:hypothetical protein